jgi:pseudouridine-5'-phosphate glycosidase
MDKKYIDNIIKEALEEADKRGIKGKKITPFLLDKIKELTAGESLDANIKLVLNNSNVAAKIAYQLCK